MFSRIGLSLFIMFANHLSANQDMRK